MSPNSCVFLCIYNKIVKKCRFRDGLWTQPCLHAWAGGFFTTNATWEASAPNPILYNPSDPSPFTSVGHSLLISKMEIIPVGSIIVRINELRSNQSILKEISPESSLEGLMLKLELHYFGHLMQRTDSWKRPWCWERLRTGEGDDRGWDGWMASPTRWTWVWVNSGSQWWTGRPGVLQSMGLQRVGHDWETELNWRMYLMKK